MDKEIPTTMMGLKREINRCEEHNNNLGNKFNREELMFLRGALWAFKWLYLKYPSPSKQIEKIRAARLRKEAGG